MVFHSNLLPRQTGLGVLLATAIRHTTSPTLEVLTHHKPVKMMIAAFPSNNCLRDGTLIPDGKPRHTPSGLMADLLERI